MALHNSGDRSLRPSLTTLMDGAAYEDDPLPPSFFQRDARRRSAVSKSSMECEEPDEKILQEICSVLTPEIDLERLSEAMEECREEGVPFFEVSSRLAKIPPYSYMSYLLCGRAQFCWSARARMSGLLS